jgi:CBS domain-containing protein
MRPITAADLMNPEVLSVPDDMTLSDLAAFLLDNEITGAPVADRRGRLVGVVSLVDLVEELFDDGEDDEPAATVDGEDDEDSELTVADVMTPEVVSLDEDATVSEVAMTMLREHLHRLVVTRDGEPVGIISTSDLLGLLIGEEN